MLSKAYGKDLDELARLVGEYRLYIETDTSLLARTMASILDAHKRNTKQAIKDLALDVMGFEPVYKDYNDFDFTDYFGEPNVGFFLGVNTVLYTNELSNRFNELRYRVDQYYKQAGVPFLLFYYLDSTVSDSMLDILDTPEETIFNNINFNYNSDWIQPADLSIVITTDIIEYILEAIPFIYDNEFANNLEYYVTDEIINFESNIPFLNIDLLQDTLSLDEYLANLSIDLLSESINTLTENLLARFVLSFDSVTNVVDDTYSQVLIFYSSENVNTPTESYLLNSTVTYQDYINYGNKVGFRIGISTIGGPDTIGVDTETKAGFGGWGRAKWGTAKWGQPFDLLLVRINEWYKNW